LIENGKVALIERHRAGKHYFVFPGGGVDDGESPEQAAVREMEEETGLRVTVQRKLAEIHFGWSEQVYYLVNRVDGEFGTGMGEEFTDSDPDDPTEGIYNPIWMPLEEFSRHENVYPHGVAALVADSERAGWPEEPIVVVEQPK
jgi:8-oxo-dGTP pyrophosphatase MutT (NUDIX family)